MRSIKFSHNYPKLHGQTSAQLLAVLPLKIDRFTSNELLEYDTTYYGDLLMDGTGATFYEKRRFPLRHGIYIQLIFLGNLRIPFCTIRSAYPPSKVEYYKSLIGEVLAVEVHDEQGA